MMRGRFVQWMMLGALLTGCGAVQAAEVSGVRVEDTVTLAGGQQLRLNGAGVRHKLMMFKLYVGALYLEKKESSAAEVFKERNAKRMAIFVLADELPMREMIASLNNALAVNLDDRDLALIESRLAQLNRMMIKVGTLKKGAVVTLNYEPGSGTHIIVNSEEMLVLKGADFFEALLHIWIGDKPVDGGLKSSLLGGDGHFTFF